MTESCIATCSRRPLPLRARSNRALTMLKAISMPVPVSPMVGPGLTGRPSFSPVMLIAPPAACAIGSNDNPFSNGLPSPKGLDLGIDDRRIDAADDIIAEPQTLNRTWREVLGKNVRLLDHLPDQCQAALVFEVDGQRVLVGVVHHEIEGVAKAGAAGFAARRFHLGDVGTHPGERLGAGRAGLELRQVEDADALEEAGRHGGYGHRRTPWLHLLGLHTLRAPPRPHHC